MKRFLALLMAMTMTVCAFTACGDTDNDKDEKTSASENDNKENPAIGEWFFEDNGRLKIKSESEASLSVTQDLSKALYFDDERNLNFSGMKFNDEDYDFDGKAFVLHGMSDNDMTMEKIDDSEELFGKYKLTGGDAYAAFTEGFSSRAAEDGAEMSVDDVSLTLEFNNNETYLIIEFPVENFELTDDAVSVSIGDNELKNAPYTVDGDTLTIINEENDKEVKLTRVK